MATWILIDKHMLSPGQCGYMSSTCRCLIAAAVLHEAIYCQGAASNWAAHAVRQEEPFATAFDAIGATQASRPVYFTGEAVFPWMLEVCSSGCRPRSLQDYALLGTCSSSGVSDSGLMFDYAMPQCLQDLTALAPIREAAELIAAKADWGPLYDLGALAKSPVRTASATYYEVSCFAARLQSYGRWLHPGLSSRMLVLTGEQVRRVVWSLL
jgi:hypothetical protein